MDPIRFGLAIRAVRRRRGLRQEDLAQLAGVSDSTIARVEGGQLSSIGFGTLEAIGRPLGVRVDLFARWHGEAIDRLLDDDHAQIVASTSELFRSCGWEVIVEASFAIGRESGSIDVFAFHPPTRLLGVDECKSVVPDAGNTLLTLDRKARLAPMIARQRGWSRADGVARFLILPEGRTNRRRIEAHANLFEAAFPVVGRDALAWIRNPTRPPIAGLLYLDVAGVAGTARSRVGRHRQIPTT